MSSSPCFTLGKWFQLERHLRPDLPHHMTLLAMYQLTDSDLAHQSAFDGIRSERRPSGFSLPLLTIASGERQLKRR